MRPVKRVLLGSAAGIFTIAGAQAADLPTKAQPVEYVKACSLYGAGFCMSPGPTPASRSASLRDFR